MLNRIPFISRLLWKDPWAIGMDRWSRRLYRQVRSIPPGCLAGVEAEPSHSAEQAEKTGWSLRCTCGSQAGRVLGYPIRKLNTAYGGDEMFVSPIAFRCAACGRVAELLDTAQHGYDAECAKRFGGKVFPGFRGEGERDGSACPECGADAHRVRAEFYFAHFDLIEDEPDLAPVAQEFFDAFGCFGSCDACGHNWLIASFELA